MGIRYNLHVSLTTTDSHPCLPVGQRYYLMGLEIKQNFHFFKRINHHYPEGYSIIAIFILSFTNLFVFARKNCATSILILHNCILLKNVGKLAFKFIIWDFYCLFF